MWSGIFFPQLTQAAFCLWGLPEVDLLASSIPLSASIIILGNSTTSGGLGVESFQPSMEVSDMLCVSSSCTSSSSSVQDPGRTCQRSTETFDSGGTMLDGGSLASHSSQHVGRYSWHCPIIKDLGMDVLVGHVLKGLLYLHLTLWLLRDVYCADRSSVSQSVRQWQGQLKHLCQRSTSTVGRYGQVGVLSGCTKQCHIFP